MAIVLTAAALLLTGCLKIDMALTVSSDNTVSGTVIMAFDKALLEASGQSAEDAVGSEAGFGDVEGVTSAPYSDDKFAGAEFTFDGVPLDKLNENSQDGGLTIKRVDDEFVVSGEMDMSTGDTPSTGDPTMDAQMADAFKSAEIRIALTFPGDVVSSNGTVSGNTVTWTPKFGEKTTLEATAKATSSSSSMLILIIGGVALIVVIIIVVMLMSRKGKGSKAPEVPAADASAAAPLGQAPVEAPADSPSPPPTEDPSPPGAVT